MMTSRLYRYLMMLIAVSMLMACASETAFLEKDRIPRDDNTIPQPESREINPFGEYFKKQVSDQASQAVDISRNLRTLFGKRKEAMNVNRFDEVENSSWFTNRNHVTPMSIADLSKGPDTGDGPNVQGKWKIISAKSQGVTPGFAIEDGDGDRYLIKFDPRGYSELASGAEVVSTKLFYAMGFNTPENYIVYFDPKILELGANVKFTDENGEKRLMVESDLEKIFEKIVYEEDGRIRALASKFISGKPLGPFTYRGLRKDDPNDFVPHHHRRELRGLRVISAWLNHFDTKDGNTLDMFVTENGRSFVKHYLIDFGATLGSASWGPNHVWRGHENDTDPNAIMVNLVSLGLYVRPWEKQSHDIKYPSIGYFEADLFEPQNYKPQVPNPAFENITGRDAFWATKIILSFTDEQLAAAVEQGRYSDPEAAAYLLDTIKKRRDIIGRYYLSRVNPLDYFSIAANGVDRKQALSFVDIAVRSGLEASESASYRYRTYHGNKLVSDWQNNRNVTSIGLPDSGGGSTGGATYWKVELEVSRDGSTWSKPVAVYLSKTDDGQFELAGVKRQS